MLDVDRVRGAMLGAALGDALARQLVGLEDRSAAPLIAEGELRYSDRTQHAMFGARALASVLPRYRCTEGLGDATAEQLAAWARADDTVSRRPGATSLRAAARLAQGESWSHTGSDSSDSVDGAFRALAAGLVLAPRRAVSAGSCMCAATHRSPVTLEAAGVVAWLVARLVRGDALTTELVGACIVEVRRWGLRGGIVESLELAVRVVAALGDQPPSALDPSLLPVEPGERSRTAVARAVMVALAYTRAPLEVGGALGALDGAARIALEGRSVAALVGALLGASGGTAVLPAVWIRQVEDRALIVALVDRLVEAATGMPVSDEMTFEPPTHYSDDTSIEFVGIESAWERGVWLRSAADRHCARAMPSAVDRPQRGLEERFDTLSDFDVPDLTEEMPWQDDD